ncbi:LysR substrate-binding domain-containing protein [Brevundimonas sp.]|uniref:LysR substrate-binding domain-containing protein n=1 Tax=Brevundimonas sp. TaxID=1871086 RepID=UPI00120CB96E|nr:LysR substrate-binding domain-containing protein [Brevundimonas sp.]TAJ56210.1 MAG: LysR family transcriptional regulator [Brevundimonas sp.]
MFENLTSRTALPSLNALRAFEAMGRTGSATRAAAELNVTHSAISRQVKALEAALGVRLFEGPKHQLRLTVRGEALRARLGAGFDTLTEAVRAARDAAEVHVAIHQSLAVKWLIPRLGAFERDCPGITLHLTDLAPAATRQRGADLMVRYLDGPALKDSGVVRLADNRIGLVCAPALAAGDLSAAPRLVARTRMGGWGEWSRLTGHAEPRGPTRTLTHLHFVLDAASAGLGIAVLPWIIVAEDVAAGRLVAPFGFVADGGALATIRSGGEAGRAARTVIRWLGEQAQATAQTAA